MNWLLLQFFIISLVPLAFLGLIIYLLPRQPGNRPLLTRWWSMTLLLLAIWSSRQLTPYLGVEINPVIPYFWQAFANYPLVLAGTTLLLVSALFLARPLARWRWLVLAGPLLALAAFFFDPALWPGRLATVITPQVMIDQFDVWAALWVAAWLVPAITAWVLCEQVVRTTPASIYRNQVVYWLIILSILFIGGTLGLVRDLLVVQQTGAIVLLVGMFLGTLAIVRKRMPNLPETARWLGYHLLRGLAVLVLSAAVLFGLTVFLLNTNDNTATIMTAAALMALTLLGALTIITRLLRRLLLPAPVPSQSPLDFEVVETGFLPLAQVADLLLAELLNHLDAAAGWLALAEEAQAGGVILRPLAGPALPNPVSLPGESPLVNHLMKRQTPLTQEDIAYLPEFSGMAGYEREIVQNWGVTVVIPLTAHGRLVGLAAVKEKKSGDRFGVHEIAEMREMGEKIGPILARSQVIEVLNQAAETAQYQNSALHQEWQRLNELVDLYRQFMGLLSPQHLRQPLTELTLELQQLESDLAPQLNGRGETLTRLQGQVDESQALVDNLIVVASHLEKQSRFELGAVYLDEVIRSVMVTLEDMIKARRVEAELFVRGQLLPVWGDRDRLEEAIYQVLHNAIKFNRLGGKIEINCQMQRDEVRLEIRDEGVGIPPARQEKLWRGLGQTASLERLGGRRRTRIGLPLVNFIVRAHGGRVEVESHHGRGSTIRLFLPARLAE